MLEIGTQQWFAWIFATCGVSPNYHQYTVLDYVDPDGKTRDTYIAAYFYELGTGYASDNPATAQQITKKETTSTSASYAGQLKQGKKLFPFTLDITKTSVHFVVMDSHGAVIHDFNDTPNAGSTIVLSP